VKHFFIFFSSACRATGSAQSVLTGTVWNNRGAGVEFVSVGVDGDSLGTVSDIND
jgi:hypothetical protein